MSKGVFIEGVTVEMIRLASLEAIETLLSEGCFEDVEIPRWTPVTERLPNADDCPMDCMVTRRSKYVGYVGSYVDMAVAEADGTWTHEDWKAIVWGDVESGRKTGLISTRDDEVIAWMPVIQSYREDEA